MVASRPDTSRKDDGIAADNTETCADYSEADALSTLVEEVLLTTSESENVEEDMDFFADDDLAEDMDVAKTHSSSQVPSVRPRRSAADFSGSLAGSLITQSVGGGRQLSRASLAWFQRQTTQNTAGLITGDGNLSDEYILQRQRVNRPAVLKSIPPLADLTTEITQVDGWVLTQLFLSGFAKLAKQVHELNKINVFPIADGDTGANMKVCLKLPVRNLLLSPSDSALSVVSNLAADVLLNGQGNSGTILSHFFVSLAEEVQASGHADTLTVDQLAQCITRTGCKMRDAVPDPVEGTMVSVARDCCNLSEEGPFGTLRDLLNVWTAKAKAELAKTPQALVVNGVKVLEKAGVVDSGAQGFAYIIEGMYLASRGELPEAGDVGQFKMASIEADEGIGTDVHVDHTVTDTDYQFCTEAVVLLKDDIDKQTVVASMTKLAAEEAIGDSIACVGAPAKQGGDMIKLHIHSNEPERVFEHLRQFSREPILRKEKVEDMREMRQLYHEDSALDLADARFSIVGLCDIVLPPSLRDPDLKTLPIFVVPSDSQEPIDIRFTNSNETCAALNRQRHADTAIRYTSAASNPMQIKIEILAALAKRKPVLVLLFSTDKRVSALGRNCLAAIEMLTPEQRSMVKVVAHGWFWCEVVFLRKVIQLAQNGKPIEEAIDVVNHLADRTCCFASFAGSATVRKLVAWRPGLFPKDFVVEDGHFFTFGLEPKIREGPVLSDTQRAGMLMNLLSEAPDYDTAQNDFIKRIKENLKPGQKLEHVMVQCSGRPDIGYTFIKKMKNSGIPMKDEPLVYSAGFVSVYTTALGEMYLIYNIVS